MNRRGTREPAGLAAAGLAAFFAAIAVIPGSPLVSRAVQAPLDEFQTLALTASNASYLSPVTLTEVRGVSIEETDTVTGTGSAGNSSIAIWTVATSTYDTTHHRQLAPASRTLAIDRATGQLVPCCGANVNGNALIRQTGVSGYVFPAGTRRQAYDVFDAVLERPEPAAYSGTGTVDGIPAYQYTEAVTAARAGASPLSATDPQLYSARRSFWVDPETGTVLAMSEDVDLYLASPATGAPAMQLFDADLTTTPGTVAQLVSQDAGVRHEITVTRELRLACLVLAGALAALAWFALAGWRALRRLRWRH